MATNTERIEALEAQAKEILSQLTAIAEGLKPKDVVKEEVKVEQDPRFPIPQEYVRLVEETFNSSFGCQLKPDPSLPQFDFSIVVPVKYSPLTEEQRKNLGGDVRSKIVSYAEGVNGVKLWCEKVFNNFNPDVRALIVADRHG